MATIKFHHRFLSETFLKLKVRFAYITFGIIVFCVMLLENNAGLGLGIDAPGLGIYDDFNWRFESSNSSPYGEWFRIDGDCGDGAVCSVENTAAEGNSVLKLTVPKPPPFLGAELKSAGLYGFGAYRVRMKTADIAGVCSSFFLYLNDENEIDIEVLSKDNGQSSGIVRFNTHFPPSSQNPQPIPVSFNPSDDYHEYGFNWYPNKIEWIIDHVKVAENPFPPKIPQSPGNIVLNCWSSDSGWTGGPPIQDTSMYVDWVWARGIWLPWSGQSKCYNASGTETSCAGTGQDGESQIGVHWLTNARFSANGDCITDDMTGLMWARDGNLPNSIKNWQGALDYVASINSSNEGLCGYKDWRLPNINELESLVNAEVASPSTWLISQGFSNMQPSFYWSSTYGDDRGRWGVVLGVGVDGPGGVINGYTMGNLRHVLPVRSGQLSSPNPPYPTNIWKTGQTTSYAVRDDGDIEHGFPCPFPRFTDLGDGTVIDNLTGLMWTKNANVVGGPRTWQGALDSIKVLNIGGLLGYHDWRLPNRKDLFSLIERERLSEYVWGLPNGHPFQNVQPNYYWSSTTVAGYPNMAWGVWGPLYSWDKSYSYFVWPVRSYYLPESSSIYVSKDRVCGGKTDCYGTVREGFDAVTVPTTINLTQEPYNENVILHSPQSILFEGGWNLDFSAKSGQTTINGSLTISSGKLIIENLILQ